MLTWKVLFQLVFGVAFAATGAMILYWTIGMFAHDQFDSWHKPTQYLLAVVMALMASVSAFRAAWREWSRCKSGPLDPT